MAMAIEIVENTDIGLKVEGDLGDLQIIEESSESDDDGGPEVSPRKVDTVANIPSNLMQPGSAPIFGTVAVTNSDNVQFGNNTFFNGPVTIKQVIQTSAGIDNASYDKTENENLNSMFHSKNNPSTITKFKLKTWHKLTFTAIGVVVIGSICAIILVTTSMYSGQEDTSFQSTYSNGENGSNLTLVLGLYHYHWNVEIVISLVVLSCIMWVFWLTLTKEAPHCEIQLTNNIALGSSQIYNRHTYGGLLIAPGHLRIVSRTDWLAQPVIEKINPIRQPVPWVVITHTATEGCFIQSECVLRVRLIQSFHIESRGWSDIGYNFMVGGDGSAYYGRGWDQEGAHTKGYNKYSIAIAFIGTFNTESPNKQQVDACRKLIRLGVAEGKLAKDYKLFAHRQLMSTLSPGDKVFDIIKTWPHFVNETEFSSLIPNY